MATYYAVNAGGNWATGATWSTVSAKDASRTGGSTAPTSADTCILDDYSGNVAASSSGNYAAVLNCTGYTGTLTIASSRAITISGDVTLSASMATSGTGTLYVNGAGATVITNGVAVTYYVILNMATSVSLNTNGTTFPKVTITPGSSCTITLLSDLQATTISCSVGYAITFSGEHDITCDTFQYTYTSTASMTFVAGRTLTVNNTLYISGALTNTITIKSGTASSDTYLHYNGTAANCRVFGVIFTDVNCAHDIVNWCGSTLTRTTGIYNADMASFPAVADVKSAVAYGGVDDASANRLTGTYSASSGVDLPDPLRIGA